MVSLIRNMPGTSLPSSKSTEQASIVIWASTKTKKRLKNLSICSNQERASSELHELVTVGYQGLKTSALQFIVEPILGTYH